MALAGFVLGVLVTLWLGPRRASEVRIEASAAERELDRPVPKIDLDDVPFDRAVAELRGVSPLPIELDSAGVAASGFDRKATVSLHGSGVPLGEILRRLLSAPQGPWLDYILSNGRIVITAPWTAVDHTFVRAYDVGGLLKSHPLELSPAGLLAFGVPQRSSGEELVSYLADSVSERPGSKSWIGLVGNRLIVCQTWEGHRQVRELLARFNAPTAIPSSASGPHIHWDQITHSWLQSTDVAQTEAALRRQIPRIEFDRLPLSQAIERLSKLSGIPIVVDLDSRGESNPFDDRVSIDLYNAPLWAALSHLTTVRPNGWELSWWVDGGVVVYSYSYREAVHQVSRVYDVSDLAGRIDDVNRLLQVAIVSANASRDPPATLALPGRPDRLIVRGNWATQEAFASVLAAMRAHPPTTQAAAH
jgi:hypothetical protein